MMFLKIGLTLLFGASFGLGVDQLADTEIFSRNHTRYEEFEDTGYCHNEDELFTHMLEDLSAEDRLVVEQKIDELLLQYGVTLEELYDNSDVHYDFMDELMTFLDEEGIDYHSNHHHGFDRYDDHHGYDDDYHGHMGMH